MTKQDAETLLRYSAEEARQEISNLERLTQYSPAPAMEILRSAVRIEAALDRAKLFAQVLILGTHS